jgi:flagellar hook-basal body complex protein FliE
MKIKSLFKLNRKTTHDERLALAQQQAQGALGLFVTANKQLDDANGALSEVINEAQREVDERMRQIEKANDELQMNMAVQKKLVDFIR